MPAKLHLAPLLLLMTALSATAASKSEIRSLSRVVVSGDAIKLSDLLPPSVSDEFRVAALNIDLGRSPQVGSRRVLTASEVLTRLQETPLAHENVVASETTTIERECIPFDRTQLKESISQFIEMAGLANQIELKNENIRLSRDLCASGQPFSVASARWDSRQQAFAVTLRPAATSHATDTLATVVLPEESLKVRLRSSSYEVRAHPKTNSVKKTPPPVIMTGQRATLLFERGPVHLSFPVVCLQSGKPQQIIRVKRIGGYSILSAEVIGAGEVRALPHPE